MRDTKEQIAKEAAAWRELNEYIDQLPIPMWAENVHNKIDRLRDGLEKLTCKWCGEEIEERIDFFTPDDSTYLHVRTRRNECEFLATPTLTPANETLTRD